MTNAILQESFGTARCGSECQLFTLKHSSGVQAKITNYGATLVALDTFDRNRELGNICLGLDSLQAYEAQDVYIGAVVGRFANRVANGQFFVNGELFSLDTNLGQHTLHGGHSSWGRRVWQVESAKNNDGCPTLVLRFDSQAGESGFPGNVMARVSYCFTEKGNLRIDFYVETDKKTPISLTHHGYFNLSQGQNPAEKAPLSYHDFEILSDRILAVDADLIPTGEYLAVDNTIFDFRKKKPLAEYLAPLSPELKDTLGFDHNYCFEPWSGELKEIANVYNSLSGRTLTVYSSLPGAQLYTGNYLSSAGIAQYGGFCIEPQYYPDSPNRDDFPFSWCTPETPYEHTIEWQFGVD